MNDEHVVELGEVDSVVHQADHFGGQLDHARVLVGVGAVVRHLVRQRIERPVERRSDFKMRAGRAAEILLHVAELVGEPGGVAQRAVAAGLAAHQAVGELHLKNRHA
jgi:hypothetical protein